MATGSAFAAAAARSQVETPTPTEATPPERGVDILTSYLPPVLQWPAKVLIAVLIVAAGVYLSKYIVRLLGRTVARRFERQSVAQIVLGGVQVGVVVLATFLAASVLGFEFGDLVLSVTVFSAVLGIVLAPIVGSIISGLFVLADQPYEIGDMIELGNGTQGFVDDITLRYTKMFTLDNTFLVIPNSSIRERDVINYSAEDERTRLTLQVLVTYESDIPKARQLLERAAVNCDDVIEGGPDIRVGSARYPATPTCYIDEYADHGVLLTLRYWAKRPYKLLATRSKVQERAWEQLSDPEVDVAVAYPHQHHVFDETSGRATVELAQAPSPRGDRRPAVGDGRDGTGDGSGAGQDG